MEQILRGTFGSTSKSVMLSIKSRRRIVKKYGVIVPVNSIHLVRQARQYSALRALGPQKPPLLRLVNPTGSVNRGVAMFVLRAVRGVLKLRYLVLGGAVTGGMTLQREYEEFLARFKEYDWLKEYLPNKEHYDAARGAMLRLQESVKLDPQLVAAYEARFQNLRGKLSERWVQALEASEKKNPESSSDKKGLANLLGGFVADLKPSVQMSAVPYTQAASEEGLSKGKAEEIIERLQNENMTLQLKHQREIEDREREIKELKKMLLLRDSKIASKRVKKSLIDMYSDVLDELSDFDSAYKAQDNLPRVVVVGDQSSGKTSVLESLVEARIFPRGAGEMMTRAPVMVTLAEGPYHIAQFKDSAKEFDLMKESDLRDLRREVEIRMKNSVSGGKTVSDSVISLTVQGPTLKRMVLVDLPGIISTVTKDMSADTREMIRYLSQTYMSNPNAIILCIQDGSVDAERSNVTDLVSQMDPQGKRTIFVLTKVDLAEQNLADPQRIKKILTGQLFPMKALGYFGVVTGTGRQDDSIKQIKEHEENFFRKSKLFKDGVVMSSQVTTRNLSLAVSECFWKMVRETVEQQADAFKAMRYNLETEWKNNFPRLRELDRDELFERARGELLDEVVALSQVTPIHWEQVLLNKLWEDNAHHVFENIYFKSAQQGEAATFKTMVDIQLKRWADQTFSTAAWEALKEEFYKFMTDPKTHKDHDPIFDQLKLAVLTEVMAKHTWEDKGAEMLRAIQLNVLEDENVPDKAQWDGAIAFFKKTVQERIANTDNVLHDMLGPGFTESWTSWKSKTPDQTLRSAVKVELEKLLWSNKKHPATLSADELITIRKNLQQNNIDADNEYIRSTWAHLYRKHFFTQSLAKSYQCSKLFFHYRQGLPSEVDCSDIVLFWKVQQILKVTANALRQQVNREAKRIEKQVKAVLEDFSQDAEKKKALLTGRRVTLAEDLKKVRQIQEKLEEFIQALNKEK